MRNWLLKLLGIHRQADDQEFHALRNEVQTLRLELSEKVAAISTMSQELHHQRDRENDRISQKVSTSFGDLIADVSTPVIQLITQAHLLEVEANPLQAKDVLACDFSRYVTH